MPLFAFLLIIIAAALHALWNFAAKKASGNLSVIWFGLAIATVAVIPFLFLLSPNQIFALNAWPFILATGIIHAFYFLFLAKAYEHGDISVVYPISRGSSVAGTAITAYFLLQEKISLPGAFGTIFISVGILLLGFNNTRQKRGIAYSMVVALLIIRLSINLA
jgi:multidrug transporter EmrE-like cation transporter